MTTTTSTVSIKPRRSVRNAHYHTTLRLVESCLQCRPTPQSDPAIDADPIAQAQKGLAARMQDGAGLILPAT
jgi:hypothetical protein